jgi:hypothetical protein
LSDNLMLSPGPRAIVLKIISALSSDNALNTSETAGHLLVFGCFTLPSVPGCIICVDWGIFYLLQGREI